MDLEPVQIAAPTLDADSLISTNNLDTMANEQTWPTDEEMRGDEANKNGNIEEKLPDATFGTTPKRVKRVPKGTSAYQAAWIVDDEEGDEDEEGSDTASDEDVEEDGEEMQEIEMEEPAPDQGQDIDDDEQKPAVAFKDLDEEEEDKQ